MVKKDLSHVPAIKYGREYESKAVDRYVQYMQNIGNPVTCIESGLVVHPYVPWLGASPDRKCIDSKVGLGLLEVKCPYSFRDIKPQGACSNPTFCCEEKGNKYFLRKDHDYYAQIQGQLALTGLTWCDFLVYTSKGMLIIRVPFDLEFWNEAVAKLANFFIRYFLPAMNENFCTINYYSCIGVLIFEADWHRCNDFFFRRPNWQSAKSKINKISPGYNQTANYSN
ncbi:uncharacterized protein LOC141915162 [Tubulanus polymorphus]|uniref:uncharacterized protein LOC141915162 n=1 Tax=Tubulanus polymorphus TaxID=672921 RepID=UPI003DA67CF3